MDHVQFPKDKEGKYDPEGTYVERPLGGVQLKVKFSQEVQFCFGVAIRETGDKNGDEEGIRLDTF
jgi:hypothetical protein